MADRSSIREKLSTFIQSELAQGEVDIEKESLVESGVIDSLGIMKLVEFIDKEFSIAIGDDELLPDNFETLDTITDLLVSK